MKLAQFFFSLTLAAILALGYVHQQVALVAAGYEVEALRRLKEELLDQRQVLHYNVLTLCSPAILDKRLAQQNIRLTTPRAIQLLTPQLPISLAQVGQVGKGQEGPSWFKAALRLAASLLEPSRPAVAEPVPEDR